MPLPGFHYFGTICPEVLKAGGILVVPPGGIIIPLSLPDRGIIIM